MKFNLDVYVIVDLSFARGRSLEEVISAVIQGGASIIQLREKRATTRQMIEMGRITKALCSKVGIPFIMNDRVDVALAIDADGVHLGPDDMPVKNARQLMGPNRIIGASAGTVAEALATKEEGADYLGVGAIYATASKADAGAPIGPAALGAIKKASMMPVVGIGGITETNAAAVIAAGADGVAVISAVVGAPDIAATVRSLRDVVRQAKAQRQPHTKTNPKY